MLRRLLTAVAGLGFPSPPASWFGPGHAWKARPVQRGNTGGARQDPYAPGIESGSEAAVAVVRDFGEVRGVG